MKSVGYFFHILDSQSRRGKRIAKQICLFKDDRDRREEKCKVSSKREILKKSRLLIRCILNSLDKLRSIITSCVITWWDISLEIKISEYSWYGFRWLKTFSHLSARFHHERSCGARATNWKTFHRVVLLLIDVGATSSHHLCFDFVRNMAFDMKYFLSVTASCQGFNTSCSHYHFRMI